MTDIVLQHRTIADYTKPLPPLPNGTWKLQALKLAYKPVTKQTKEGDDVETVEYLLTVQPIEPTSSVSPEELEAAVDPKTGRPTYDGKRIFLRFIQMYYGDMKSLGEAMRAMGFTGDDTFEGIADEEAVKGRTAYGDVWTREYKTKDGREGYEQKVRTWSDKGGSAAFAL